MVSCPPRVRAPPVVSWLKLVESNGECAECPRGIENVTCIRLSGLPVVTLFWRAAETL